MTIPPLRHLRKTCIAVAITQCVALPLEAATIVVNTLADTNGVNNTCSLRDAISSANTNGTAPGSNCVPGSGDDIIEFTGLSGEITLSSELPFVTSNIILQGPGQDTLTISGNNNYGILRTTGSSVLNIDSLTLSNGTRFQGGAVYVTNSVILSINNCTLTGNSAYLGAAVAAYGANPVNPGELPSIFINNTTLSGNSVSNVGGAVIAYDIDSLSISNSVLFDNSAGVGGGAIYALDTNNLSISNSTLSGNSTGSTGGAILIQNMDNASIINSTLTGNSVSSQGGAVKADSLANLTISNSLFSGNTSSGGGSEISFTSTTITTDTHNIFGDSSQSFADAFTGFTPSAASIIATSTIGAGTVNPNALVLSSIIAPLVDNGGSTLTHSLVAGSPAINQGDNAICAAAPINNLDQLGGTRPIDGVCDIGSVEYIDSGEPGTPESAFFVVPIKNGKAVIFSL